MSFAGVMLILFIVFLVLAMIFVSMPRVKEIRWTEEREAVMYKSAFWSIILSVISLVISLISFAKGY